MKPVKLSELIKALEFESEEHVSMVPILDDTSPMPPPTPPTATPHP